MSKSTKIIAALGVVAGLGVAALPAFTYAQESATGDVDVLVQVQPAIAMTIEGNNDDNSVVDEGTHTATDSFSPAGIAGGELDGHTIPATSVTGTSSSAWSMLPNALKEGGDFKSTITVYTNSTTGYTLSVADANTDASLTQQVVSGTADTIDPITSAKAGVLTAGDGMWGYRVGTSGDWLAMPISTATAASIGSEDVKTSDGTEYVVEYGVATKADQSTGIYKDTIVYTATTK